jgi:hypothetical protein
VNSDCPLGVLRTQGCVRVPFPFAAGTRGNSAIDEAFVGEAFDGEAFDGEVFDGEALDFAISPQRLNISGEAAMRRAPRDA